MTSRHSDANSPAPQVLIAVFGTLEIAAILQPFGTPTANVLDACNSKLHLSPTFILAMCFSLLGAYGRRICMRLLGPLFTGHLSLRDGHHLITTGPYSIVRHPSYTALYVQSAGIITIHAAAGSWYRECMPTRGWLSFIVYVVAWFPLWRIIVTIPRRSGIEDKALKLKFGKEWEEWAERVRYTFVPGVL